MKGTWAAQLVESKDHILRVCRVPREILIGWQHRVRSPTEAVWCAVLIEKAKEEKGMRASVHGHDWFEILFAQTGKAWLLKMLM